jgi:hypothetical protein
MRIFIKSHNQPLSIHVIWGILLIGMVVIWPFLPHFACPFHQITGYPCLACGASRAVDALYGGRIVGMFGFNPLLVTFCVGLFLFSLLKLFEFILHIKIEVKLSPKAALFGKILIGLAAAANWLFLIVSNR